MENTKRRSFLTAGIASFPLGLLGQTGQTSNQPPTTRVAAGADRFGEHHTLGVSCPLVTCITTRRSGFT